MKESAILDRAAHLVEAGWTQGKLARTSDGAVADLLSDEAVKFCLTGAIMRTAIMRGGEPTDGFEVVREVLGGQVLIFWNDDQARTQEDVVRALRKAARLAHEREEAQ